MPTLGLDFNQDDPQMTIKCIDALAQSGAQFYRKGMSCCLPGGAHEDGHGARCTLSTESDSSVNLVYICKMSPQINLAQLTFHPWPSQKVKQKRQQFCQTVKIGGNIVKAI